MKKQVGSIFRQSVAVLSAFLMLGSQASIFAQAMPQDLQAQQGVSQEMPQAPAAVNTGQPTPVMDTAQLDSLVAPLALYPDPLLSQILVASTYPLEVVEAGQWVQQNPNLSGAALENAAKQQNWDPSIQALVAFPDVLKELSSNIQWTTQLGNAFLAQQSGVMDAVQRLRGQAVSAGKLQSTPQQVVTTENQGGASAIEIQPANPQVIYVPSYDPASVWGPSPYYPYPVLSYPYYPYGYVGGIGFGTGIMVGAFFGGWGGWLGWGWHPNWFGRTVIVNNGFFGRYGFNRGFYGRAAFAGSGVWMHDPMHRLGVAYPNRQVAAQFHAVPRAPISSSFRAGAMARSEARPMSSGSGFARSTAPSRGFAPSRSFAAAPRTAAPSNAYRGAASNNFNSRAQVAPRQAPAQSYRNFSSAAPRAEAPHYSAPARSGGFSGRSSGGFSGGHSGGGHSGGGHGRR